MNSPGRQRTHVLIVLSHPVAGKEGAFTDWYQGVYRDSVLGSRVVLSLQHYERHEFDLSQGEYSPLPFDYLGLCEICVDGASAAEDLIDRVTALHGESGQATAPATWLYYPVSEKAGRAPNVMPSLLTLAFANALPGREDEFREWYATRHIRHALQVPALVSGQCLQRTLFQKPGSLASNYSTVAVYEQEGSPESIVESFKAIPASMFDFPALDASRANFSEWVYRPLLDDEK